MYDVCKKEKQEGRVPRDIDFYLADLPSELAAKLRDAKERASREVRPSRSVE